MRTALVCVLLGCAVAQAHAEPPKSADPGSNPRLSGELTTRSGNQLRAEFLQLDCRGLSIKYLDNVVTVPLKSIAAASSGTNLPVFPGTGGDKLIGKLVVRAGTIFVTTRELGKLHFPIAEIQCERDPTNPRSVSGRPSNPIGPSLSETEMGSVRGTGPIGAEGKTELAAADASSTTPADNQQPSQSGKPADGQSSQSTKPANAEVAPGAQNAPPGSADQNAPSGSADQKKPPKPKEQEEETERNTLEFLRNEAVLVQPNKIEGDFSIGYLHTNQLLGNQKLLTGVAAGRFGIIRGLEAFIAVPGVFGQRQTFTATTISNQIAGVGDVKFGVKYNVINEFVDRPAVVVGVTGTAPTGRYPYLSPRRLNSGQTTSSVQGGDTRDPLNVQAGTGHWQVTSSVTALKSFDPIVLFGSINYTYYVPATYYGVHINPGDIFEVNAGIGFAVNDRATLSSQVFVDYAQKWKFNGVAVPQTGITPISMRLAYTQVITPEDLIEPSVIFGLSRDATDAVVSVDWIHRF